MDAQSARLPIDVMRAIQWAWIGFGVVWLIGALRTKRVARRQNVASRVSHLVPAIAAGYLISADVPWRFLHQAWAPPLPELELLGLGLVVVGMTFAIWARVYLGGNWSGTVTVKQDHELVRSGPYAIVRHPIYSGILLAMLGTAVAQREIRGLLATALLLLAFWVKSRYEEGFMRETFGAAYDEYRASTGALVPKSWPAARSQKSKG